MTLLNFSFHSRRLDIPRQDSLARGSGRPIAPLRMNVRPWLGSAVLACSIHSFLGGGDKQPVELLAGEDRIPRQRRRRADGRNDVSGAQRTLV